ncbi:hypothetical protein ASE74_19510 [Pedobacter sp. Leaf216]|uniref:alpha/beta hydrolase n=1 Tax=Pedobacter sp. Leaf216 TaxID=1735684 RepID=UPI0006FDD291|nr:alpha/beta hydrolase [Pedobacter sp. Leaf216]KQM76243.1 hypothetical protein ASE74_19510 [Pedobacter sp. Leaf216]
MKNAPSNTIVFITGAFVTNDCWKEWTEYFQQMEFKVFAPAWPHKDAPACTLRQRQPDAQIASQRLASLIEYFSQIIAQLDEIPILIGHSMGGLIAQLLLQKGQASAAIAIHSLQPQGVFTFKYSFYKAGWKALGFFTNPNKSYLMSFSAWQYAFTNGMDYDAQKEAYYSYLAPESKLLIRDATTTAAKIDFANPHQPLLFISGSEDRFIPASLNYTNYQKYTHQSSITAYKEFPGRNHFVLGQPGWKEIADYISSWLLNLKS